MLLQLIAVCGVKQPFQVLLLVHLTLQNLTLNLFSDNVIKQEILERKEEVHHELTLHQLDPEGKSVSEEAEDATVLRGEWDDETDEDEERESSDLEGCSDECLSPGSTDEAQRSSKEGQTADLEQVDNELAMLIYKNGLVFDMKADLP